MHKCRKLFSTFCKQNIDDSACAIFRKCQDSRSGNSDVSEAAAFVYLVAKINGYIA